MKINSYRPALYRDVIELFTDVFTDSEGQREGRLIERLVTKMLDTTNPEDLYGFVGMIGEQLAGCILFSRLELPSGRSAFILSPVAVASDRQGKGLGQQLINYGIESMKQQGAELLFTYGDPSFYAKVGFEQISEDIVRAPRRLSQPQGWLAQSLDGRAITPESGPARCIPALDDQTYW